MLALVFAGFARSFFLHAAFGTRPLTGFLIVHGLLMTAWMVLLVVQSALIAGRRVSWHRRLGLFGGALAGVLVPLAFMVIVADARRQMGPGDTMVGLFVAFDGLHLLAFTALTGAGLALRERPAVHKRLMVFGTLNLLPPALGRLAARELPGAEVPAAVLAVMVGLILAFAAADAGVSRRWRRVDLVGAAVSVAVTWFTYRYQVG